jgi:hypothetical protein
MDSLALQEIPVSGSGVGYGLVGTAKPPSVQKCRQKTDCLAHQHIPVSRNEDGFSSMKSIPVCRNGTEDCLGLQTSKYLGMGMDCLALKTSQCARAGWIAWR